ncbi:hypothetical protein E6W43_03290 [Bacillus sp. seq1]|nr:hypothetical protein [Bacillus subtilis]NOV05443.1 hypothetical protein [Bacillus sp. seq1]
MWRLIRRYEMIFGNSEKQNLLEDLPVSLTYEIAKPSSESKIFFIHLGCLPLKHHRIHSESPNCILGVLGIYLVRTSQKQF